MEVLGIDIRVYFLLFMSYAFFGWLMEVVGKLIQYKRFINRGFLIGPYCPIYGNGAILITLLLQKYTSDPIVLFFMAILICGTLEYLTSYLMEKLFKARWWDYSQRKFNINGRVCLNTIIPFGLLGCFIMYISNPFLLGLIESMQDTTLTIVFWTILAIFVLDNIVSFVVVGGLRKTTTSLGKDLDNTEEITKRVKEILTKKSFLYRRFLNAYPKIQSVKTKLKQKSEEIRQDVKIQKEELQKRIELQKNEVQNKIDNQKEEIQIKIENNKNIIKEKIENTKTSEENKNVKK